MKNKLLHFLSLSFLSLGIAGLVWTNLHVPSESQKSKFDSSLKIDETLYKSKTASKFDRVAAINRLSVKKNREVRSWILENLDSEIDIIQKSMIEALGYFPDPKVNKVLLEIIKGENTKFRLMALKSLGTVENESRKEILSHLETKNWSRAEVVQFHFSHFKTKSYFTQKKLDLVWLIEFAKRQSDGDLLRVVVTGLAKIVPNFERYHELLKELLYKSSDEFIINQSIIHLSVYQKKWLALQSQEMINTQNEMKIRSFLQRSGAFCPKDLEKVIQFYNREYKVLDFSNELKRCL
jgi:HEAT repeat protein